MGEVEEATLQPSGGLKEEKKEEYREYRHERGS
jgi:hypothetical protein